MPQHTLEEIPAFCRRLQRALHESNPPFESLPELIVQPKADLHFPICGAASIVAKVHRDDLIEDLKALGDIGSGYPSDPKTRSWLTGFLIRGEPFPSCVRQRWGTVDKTSTAAAALTGPNNAGLIYSFL